MWKRAQEFQAAEPLEAQVWRGAWFAGAKEKTSLCRQSTLRAAVELHTSVELRVGVTVREVGVHLRLGALGESSAPNIGPLQLHMCT